MSTVRLFFAIWPSEAVVDALYAIATCAKNICGGRLMRRETLHLTLAFLGELGDQRVADAKRVADGIYADTFDLVLDQIGYWKHNRILWAGGESPRLTLLARHLNDGLRAAGFRLDSRPFVAHMTLLRDARGGELPTLAEPVTWRVNEFALVESKLSPDGARYETVGRWPLAVSASSG